MTDFSMLDDGTSINGAALHLIGLDFSESGWFICAQPPVVTVTKHPTEDKYRIVIDGTNSDGGLMIVGNSIEGSIQLKS